MSGGRTSNKHRRQPFERFKCDVVDILSLNQVLTVRKGLEGGILEALKSRRIADESGNDERYGIRKRESEMTPAQKRRLNALYFKRGEAKLFAEGELGKAGPGSGVKN